MSRQVRALEDHLGLPLFHRRHRALVLTAEGERLFRFDGRLVALGTVRQPLRPDFAYWLVPRQGADTASRAQLVDWLTAEAERTRTLVAASLG